MTTANVAKQKPKIAGAAVAVGEVVRELVRGDPERDDERQVVEQLERRRGAVRLVRVATGHPPPMVRAVVDGVSGIPRMLPRDGCPELGYEPSRGAFRGGADLDAAEDGHAVQRQDGRGRIVLRRRARRSRP